MKQAERRKFHYIYKITRTDGSGKYYIGMHSTDDLDDGYFGSGMLLWKSIKKHGKEKHSKEILEQLDSREALKLREKAIVNTECVADPLCMNLQLGGGGGQSSEVGLLAWFGNLERRLNQSARLSLAWQDPRFRLKHSALSSVAMKKKHCEGKMRYDTFIGKNIRPLPKYLLGQQIASHNLELVTRNLELVG